MPPCSCCLDIVWLVSVGQSSLLSSISPNPSHARLSSVIYSSNSEGKGLQLMLQTAKSLLLHILMATLRCQFGWFRVAWDLHWVSVCRDVSREIDWGGKDHLEVRRAVLQGPPYIKSEKGKAHCDQTHKAPAALPSPAWCTEWTIKSQAKVSPPFLKLLLSEILSWQLKKKLIMSF